MDKNIAIEDLVKTIGESLQDGKIDFVERLKIASAVVKLLMAILINK